VRGALTRAAVAIALVAVPLSEAGATRARFGADGAITVYDDMGACAVLEFDQPVTGSGQLTSDGVVNGPGTITAPVAGAQPVVLVGATSWYGCLPDSYAGAATGAATYQLTATTTAGDYAEVLVCTVRLGWVTCR